MAKYEYENIKILVENKKLNKVNIAIKLGISRPTLDSWLTKYRRDNDLIIKYSKKYIEHIAKLEKENLELKNSKKTNTDKNDTHVDSTIDMAWDKIFK